MKDTTARVARTSLRLLSARKDRTALWEAAIRRHAREEPTPMRRPWSKLKSVVTAREGSTVPMKAREFQVYKTYERIFFDDSIREVFSFFKGATDAVDLCWGGYYCPPGQHEPNPAQYICPRGMHCPNGSETYHECTPGSYTNYTGAASCDVCPEGFYCLTVQLHNADDNLVPCPAGYYCPEGTGHDWQSCPAGTYSDTEGLSDVTQCTACPGGKYCADEHMTTWSGDCDAGKRRNL